MRGYKGGVRFSTLYELLTYQFASGEVTYFSKPLVLIGKMPVVTLSWE